MLEPGINKFHRTGNPQLDVLALEVERAQLAAVDAASKAERAYAGVQRLDTENQRHGWHTGGAVVALILLAAVIGAAAWWTHGALTNQGLSLAKLPTLEQSLEALRGRMSGAENTLGRLPDDWNNMTVRLASLENRLNNGLQTARRQTQEATAQVDHKVEVGIDRQNASLREQVAQLEFQREADAAKITALDSELRSTQRDMNQQMASIRRTIPADAAPELASVRSEMARHAQDIHAISDQLERSVVGFEVAQHRSTQLTPGVYLNISKLDVDKQQVNGWLYLANEHRTMWLHNQGLLKPVTIGGVRDSKQSQEVILTRVSKDDVSGYVLVPKSSAGDSASAN